MAHMIELDYQGNTVIYAGFQGKFINAPANIWQSGPRELFLVHPELIMHFVLAVFPWS